MRKKIGMTQYELAQQAGVSQSLIAKIESGIIDPAYSKVEKITKTLERLHHHQEHKAKEVMQKKIILVGPKETIQAVIEKMKKHNISQLPVVEHNVVLGSISETALLEGLLNKKGSTVKDLMQEAPPIIAPDTGISIVSHLLQFSPLVLVAEQGTLKGIITKSDILAKMKFF